MCNSLSSDWGLVITYGGGGYKIEKSHIQNCLHPHFSRQGKTFIFVLIQLSLIGTSVTIVDIESKHN